MDISIWTEEESESRMNFQHGQGEPSHTEGDKFDRCRARRVMTEIVKSCHTLFVRETLLVNKQSINSISMRFFRMYPKLVQIRNKTDNIMLL